MHFYWRSLYPVQISARVSSVCFSLFSSVCIGECPEIGHYRLLQSTLDNLALVRCCLTSFVQTTPFGNICRSCTVPWKGVALFTVARNHCKLRHIQANETARFGCVDRWKNCYSASNVVPYVKSFELKLHAGLLNTKVLFCQRRPQSSTLRSSSPNLNVNVINFVIIS
jgi:hypothetical protein